MWILPEVTDNITVLVQRRNKTRQARSMEVKREPKEWHDIWVSHKAPNLTLLDQFLFGERHERRQHETAMVLLLLVYQPRYLLVPSLPPGTMNIRRSGEEK